MTRGAVVNPFDLNSYKVEYPELGAHLSYLVAGTLSLPEGSRARAIEALRAVQLLLGSGGGLDPSATATAAVSLLGAELNRVEIALADLEDGCAPDALLTPSQRQGRRPTSGAELAFQSRCVVAVAWLQMIGAGGLSRADAENVVAKIIPPSLHQTRGGVPLSAREQLAAWRDAFGRRGTRGHGAIQAEWWALEENWAVGKRGLEHATREDVIAWLVSARDSLEVR